MPIVDINGMFARLDQAQGPMIIAANQGRYNIDTQRVAIDGPVKVAGADGFRLDDPRRDGRHEAAAARQQRSRWRARCASGSSRRGTSAPTSANGRSCSTAALA